MLRKGTVGIEMECQKKRWWGQGMFKKGMVGIVQGMFTNGMVGSGDGRNRGCLGRGW